MPENAIFRGRWCLRECTILDLGFRAIFVPFGGKKCDFLQVFVPRVLIFKKLHLLLHSKMEVQGEKCVENH